MIRFLPDTWREAVLRPLAMASPDGSVYVEIIAPDFRFLFIIVLALGCLLFARRIQHRTPATLVLFAVTAAAFVPWLETTGNGRYFIAVLLIAGPLTIGLLQLIPASRTMRLALAVGIVSWQSFLIHEVSPWGYWGHVMWADGPPFDIEVPVDVVAQPATYVTLANITYSLIAPRFHPASRWINIASTGGEADRSADGLRAQGVIAGPGPLRVIFPTVPGGQKKGDAIDEELAIAIDQLLSRQGLSIEAVNQCRLLRSNGLAGMASSRLEDQAAGRPNVHGFWLCPLARHASANVAEAPPIPTVSEQTFEKLEHMCPRLFSPGSAVSLRIPAGAVRGYPDSDFKIYVLDNGRVYYKYYRALNAVDLGNVASILSANFAIDCNHVRGRSGMPWERDI